ncbi:MAG: gamma carbonic anhydrase family protein [Candidatus Acidulodesulfobacterium ferriphilum]|uniref:Gamma carbonic anhydrase family protein n=1 Tax=Candidatus Acidulodesulfobacterium ferriphilum TaxID=2597223 RepID=A0A519BDF1_9DELT|nr:MAG: gamma carbonic anhydrase family protein [Candidatus Acidulodesulfobacterium ferriphilum]
MIIRHRGFEPQIGHSVFVAPTAVVCGKVGIGKDSRIMYGAVLDSEGSHIEIGECVIILENAVIRATALPDKNNPVIIGNNVNVGPHATLLGCTVGPNSFIATGATILHGAIIQSGAVVAVSAFVHANTVIPKGFLVPPHTVAIGSPVKIYGTDDKEALADAVRAVGFVKAAYGVEADWEDGGKRYKRVTEARSKELGEHFNDIILDK